MKGGGGGGGGGLAPPKRKISAGGVDKNKKVSHSSLPEMQNEQREPGPRPPTVRPAPPPDQTDLPPPLTKCVKEDYVARQSAVQLIFLDRKCRGFSLEP